MIEDGQTKNNSQYDGVGDQFQKLKDWTGLKDQAHAGINFSVLGHPFAHRASEGVNDDDTAELRL